MKDIFILTLFGGTALLLYGMKLAGEGLQKAGGMRLKNLLFYLTANRLIGVGVGILLTLFLQSSNATLLMLLGLASSGALKLSQAMGIILGADIGTTITVQLLAFKIYDFAIFFAGVGISLMLLSKRMVPKNIGQGILGFSLVFLAIKVISESLEPVGDSLLKPLFLVLTEHPLTGLIIFTILTAILQSSAAAIGLILALSLQGIIDINGAMPLILGANIGACGMAIISSIGSNVEAKQVAASHIIFKILGVVIFYPFIDVFSDIVKYTANDVARQVANAHTLFNVGIAILFLPFSGLFASFIKYLIPEKEEEKEVFGPKYLDKRVLSSPSMAFAQATREALRMADIVQDMLRQSIIVFQTDNIEMVEEVEKKDDYLDLLDREIKLYLTNLSQSSLTPSQTKKEQELIAFTGNLENIGDIIDKNLMELAKKKINKALSFSKDGTKEIKEFHQRVMENFELAISAFASRDISLAKKVLENKADLSALERDLRQAHIQRLHMGLKESIDTSSIHLDVLSNIKRINSHITNIVYPIIEMGE